MVLIMPWGEGGGGGSYNPCSYKICSGGGGGGIYHVLGEV